MQISKRLSLNVILHSQLRFFIARPTRVTGVLGKNSRIREDYTRAGLKRKIERPNYNEEILEIERIKAEEAEVMRNFSRPANDKNPLNYVPVKISNTFLTSEVPQPITQPIITFVQPRTTNPHTSKGIRRKIPVSPKKMSIPVALAKKRHVKDLLKELSSSPKKSARYLERALSQVMNHAKEKKLDEMRLYIKSISLGKHKRIKRLRYHAKMRNGTMIRDTTQLLIELEEKPLEEFFMNMLQGKFPKTLAEISREEMKNGEADFATIQKYQPILTAKGRQQQRLMFKRTVERKMNELKANGQHVSQKYVEELMLKEFVKPFIEKYSDNSINQNEDSLANRRTIFEENEKS